MYKIQRIYTPKSRGIGGEKIEMGEYKGKNEPLLIRAIGCDLNTPAA